MHDITSSGVMRTLLLVKNGTSTSFK